MMLLNSLHAAFKDLTPLETFLVLFVVCFCFVKDAFYHYIVHIVGVKHKPLALYHSFKGFLSASLIMVTKCVILNAVPIKSRTVSPHVVSLTACWVKQSLMVSKHLILASCPDLTFNHSA